MKALVYGLKSRADQVSHLFPKTRHYCNLEVVGPGAKSMLQLSYTNINNFSNFDYFPDAFWFLHCNFNSQCYCLYKPKKLF